MEVMAQEGEEAGGAREEGRKVADWVEGPRAKEAKEEGAGQEGEEVAGRQECPGGQPRREGMEVEALAEGGKRAAAGGEGCRQQGIQKEFSGGDLDCLAETCRQQEARLAGAAATLEEWREGEGLGAAAEAADWQQIRGSVVRFLVRVSVSAQLQA